MKKETKKIPYLDSYCVVGEKVQWDNIKGDHFVGKLISLDAYSVATVELEDGTIVNYQC